MGREKEPQRDGFIIMGRLAATLTVSGGEVRQPFFPRFLRVVITVYMVDGKPFPTTYRIRWLISWDISAFIS